MHAMSLVSLFFLLAAAVLGQPKPQPPPVDKVLFEQALAGPLAGIEEIVFAVRYPGGPSADGHWYASFGYYAHDRNRKAYSEGAKLVKLNLRTGKVTTILEEPRGGVRDPQVHYDGKKILFSYRKGETEYYHLHEINTDGTGLRQLTDGPWDDLEPTYLPSGEIVFVSSRAKRWVNCWLTQVAILYQANADGSGIRPISSNGEQDNTPWPLSDGRLMYTRWEYVDRSQVDYHHLWAANPDGTGQMIFYGNLHPGTVMIDAKPIPDSSKVVAIFSPGHGRREHDGAIAVVDPSAGPDLKEAAREITPLKNFRDPWAFSENLFLAARGPSLLLIDSSGRMHEIHRLSGPDLAAKFECHEPRPITRRRPEPLIPTRTKPSETTGTLVLSDIYRGRNMAGVERGEIRKLLVIEVLPMPIHHSGGMEPISLGGTFTLERIAGTVPVEPDGSAHLELPALRSFFFVALDKDDMSVKRMQSFLTVQPGEVTGCVGCHEQRTQAPPPSAKPPLAVRRPASRIEPIADVPDVLDFPRDIQPILDRHCLSCHDYDKRQGGVILSGDRGPVYSHSYVTLTFHRQVADGRNLAVSNYPPRALGSSASPLMKKISGGHYGVRVTPREQKTVRLWIETGAAYPGTYASVGTGMIGSYIENKLVREDERWPMTQVLETTIRRRCGSCHDANLPLPVAISMDPKFPDTQPKAPGILRYRFSRQIVFNLSRPEKSMMLLAPLAREHDGYGICKGPVFEGTADADYQTMLASISDAKRRFEEAGRFDMPSFRPSTHWVREMKRFGILPADHDASKAVDYYAAERRYWESLWYRPE